MPPEPIRCCTGTHTVPLTPQQPPSPPAPLRRGGNPNVDDTYIYTTASALEDAIESILLYPPDGSGDDDDGVGGEPVTIHTSADAHLLHCPRRRPQVWEGKEVPMQNTVLGIMDHRCLFDGTYRGTIRLGDEEEEDVPVRAMLLEPSLGDEMEGCRYAHPRGSWIRGNAPQEDWAEPNGRKGWSADLTLIDLTVLQRRRREGCDGAFRDMKLWNSPGGVFHLLRSVLTSGACSDAHSASPWSFGYERSGGGDVVGLKQHHPGIDPVVAILVSKPPDVQDAWDELERLELDEILKFRTGDAAPSYFLHSASHVSGGSSASRSVLGEVLNEVVQGDSNECPTNQRSRVEGMLLVYRHLPPRDHLTVRHPLERHVHNSSFAQNGHGASLHEAKIEGCLWETYVPPRPPQDDDGAAGGENGHHNGHSAAPQSQPVLYRQMCPPYLNHTVEYPKLLDEILTPENVAALRDEALRIPQWTAWPETQHYQSSAGDADNDGDGDGDENNSSTNSSPYPASWTVFPLCHTFPASDVTQRKWINKTCSFVPRTTSLLRNLGPHLRTALFSRLDPRTTLAAHTGWADLANYVHRVHIPLIVPGGMFNEGLCGTWVDGCVETHDPGRVICFDDAKVHRAFNYTDEERIVLIVDLARPECLPLGTATGGHSDELDAFIEQLT